jgi:hypothetical protein
MTVRSASRNHDWHLALADRLIAGVGTGQEAGVTARGCAHLLTAVSRRVGAEHEGQETASFFQSCPDAPGLSGRVHTGGITNDHPANRNPGVRRHHAAEMDGAAEGDAGARMVSWRCGSNCAGRVQHGASALGAIASVVVTEIIKAAADLG